MAWDGIHRNQPQKERKMTKAEALRKMEELREFIEECDKPPHVQRGQLWKALSGDIYLVAPPRDGGVRGDSFRATNISGASAGCLWNNDNGFGSSAHEFTYVGMASDLLVIKQ